MRLPSEPAAATNVMSPRSQGAAGQLLRAASICRPISRAQVADLEKRLIDQAMQASRYRQPQAAELLGLTYNQLRAMLRKYELVERYGRARS